MNRPHSNVNEEPVETLKFLPVQYARPIPESQKNWRAHRPAAELVLAAVAEEEEAERWDGLW